MVASRLPFPPRTSGSSPGRPPVGGACQAPGSPARDTWAAMLQPGNRETAGVSGGPSACVRRRMRPSSRARCYQRRPASSTRAELPIAASASRMRNVATRKLRFIFVTTAPWRSEPFRDGTRRRGEHEARQDRLHVPLLSVRRAPGNRAAFRQPEGPWLCVPASRRVCPGREPDRAASIATASEATQRQRVQQWDTGTGERPPGSAGGTSTLRPDRRCGRRQRLGAIRRSRAGRRCDRWGRRARGCRRGHGTAVAGPHRTAVASPHAAVGCLRSDASVTHAAQVAG